MNSVNRFLYGFFLSILSVICICFQSVEAVPFFMTTAVNVNIENDQAPIDSKNIDDLLGPDANFPFDPANHRDGSNPIKRIGKISDGNL